MNQNETEPISQQTQDPKPITCPPVKNQEPERTPKLILIIGTNGTGKTTMADKLLHDELRRPEGRALIITPHDIEWLNIPLVHSRLTHHIETYVNARRIIFEDENTIEFVTQYFRSGLLIFDDCRAYFKSTLERSLHKLMISRRQWMIDILAMGHGFTEIPPKFFTFATHIILFRTTDNVKQRREVLRDYEQMAAAQLRVNQQALLNPHYYEILENF